MPAGTNESEFGYEPAAMSVQLGRREVELVDAAERRRVAVVVRVDRDVDDVLVAAVRAEVADGRHRLLRGVDFVEDRRAVRVDVVDRRLGHVLRRSALRRCSSPGTRHPCRFVVAVVSATVVVVGVVEAVAGSTARHQETRRKKASAHHVLRISEVTTLGSAMPRVSGSVHTQVAVPSARTSGTDKPPASPLHATACDTTTGARSCAARAQL